MKRKTYEISEGTVESQSNVIVKEADTELEESPAEREQNVVIDQSLQKEVNQKDLQSGDMKEQTEEIDLEQLLNEVDKEQAKIVGEASETQDNAEHTSNQQEVLSEQISGIDWSALKPTQSRAIEKISSEEGVLSMINCLKNGNRRISVSAKLFETLGNPKTVELGIMPNGLAIAEKLPIKANTFSIKQLGAKRIIYAGALVNELTNEFDLDYSQRTSITFPNAKYDEVDGYKVALIVMK